MPNYVRYADDLETLEPDEAETHAKIIEVMSEGLKLTRETNHGKAIRISHAKAHGLLKGELVIHDHLSPELAQGLFARPGTYPVLVRISHAPGERVDDSKVSTPRGIAIKVFGVTGAKIAPFEDITTQDFVFDTGKEFISGGAKAFLQAFKPNAKLAPRLSDTVKGAVSDLTRGTNTVLESVGMGSAKLDFYGHPKRHPMEEPYYSQTPYRYGDYVAKFGVIPASPGLRALAGQDYDPQTYDALRDATVEFFRNNPAEFDFVVQLNTDPEQMPIEDATVPWSEELSSYRTVARLILPVQEAYDPAREDYVEEDLSFAPAHALEAHRPLGSINRARMAAYTTLSTLRRQTNNRPVAEPVSLDQVPK